MKNSLKFSLLAALLIIGLFFQSVAFAMTIQPYFPGAQNLQNGISYPNYINPQVNQLIYVDKNSGFAVSSTGKLFLLETDYSGKIKKITDQHGKPVFMRNNQHYYNPYTPLHDRNILNNYWNYNNPYSSIFNPFNYYSR